MLRTTQDFPANKWNAPIKLSSHSAIELRELGTFPSYSFRWSTSGAMYAGVPTVDLGWECNKADCKAWKIQNLIYQNWIEIVTVREHQKLFPELKWI